LLKETMGPFDGVWIHTFQPSTVYELNTLTIVPRSLIFILHDDSLVCLVDVYCLTESDIKVAYMWVPKVSCFLYEVMDVSHWRIFHQDYQTRWVITGQHWN